MKQLLLDPRDSVEEKIISDGAKEVKLDLASIKEDNSCVNLFVGNKVENNGMSLDYATPQLINCSIVVQLDK